MNSAILYDACIVGGGLAGLALSIQLAKKGYRTAVFEKETYPFHKVCGEYISMESWDFLTGLGIPLADWKLPEIHQLRITSPAGKMVEAVLPQGGFGVSRYKLDASLAAAARSAGVDVFEQHKVSQILFENERHVLKTGNGSYEASVVCACYGKKANLDVKWKRDFLRKKSTSNYVGVKYHVQADLPEDQILLHNFKGGYCGISRIEDGKYCLCYLTKSENLKAQDQSIPLMEEKVLKRNPELKRLLEQVKNVYDEPVTIAQISFAKKTQTENHILFVGDAAGMITPLCGNGMSMALHGSKLAAGVVSDFLEKKTGRREMEIRYRKQWTKEFGSRMRSGRIIQSFFGNRILSGLLIGLLKPFPFLVRAVIRRTHGDPF